MTFDSIWENLKQILIHLAFILGDSLSKVNIEFIQEFLQSFCDGFHQLMVETNG